MKRFALDTRTARRRARVVGWLPERALAHGTGCREKPSAEPRARGAAGRRRLAPPSQEDGAARGDWKTLRLPRGFAAEFSSLACQGSCTMSPDRFLGLRSFVSESISLNERYTGNYSVLFARGRPAVAPANRAGTDAFLSD